MAYRVNRMLKDDTLDPDYYFECQYVDENGVQCKNTTFVKEDIIKLASYKVNDFYVEEVVDAAVRCTRCNHIQSIGIDMNSVSFTKLLKPKK